MFNFFANNKSKLESTPPDKNIPILTSDIKFFLSTSNKSYSSSLISNFLSWSLSILRL